MGAHAERDPDHASAPSKRSNRRPRKRPEGAPERAPEPTIDLQRERRAALRKARRWSFGLPAVLFVFDLYVIPFLLVDPEPYGPTRWLTAGHALAVAYFGAAWLLTRRRPLIGCALAIAGAWGLHFYLEVHPESLLQHWGMNAVIAVAVLRGIGSAYRAERLAHPLGATARDP